MLLRDKDKQTLLGIFSAIDLPFAIWAYGSRVNGTAHDGSDLDIVMRGKDLSPIPIDTFIDLREKIRESNIPILVDLHDWAYLPATFHKNIEQQYEVLFDNMNYISIITG